DGSMARRPELEVFAREHGLKIGSIEDLIRHRLATEHTVERVDERAIDTAHGAFRLITYRDRVSRELHFAMVRGAPSGERPALVRVHVKNPLSDVLRWRRPDFGGSADEAMARIAAEGEGVLVVLGDTTTPEALLARITEQPEAPAGRVQEWRRNGAGSQILADLGLKRLRVLGTPRRQIGLGGFGLEVLEYLSVR
ncbi:MAG: bifunctional 3,4-dihydroxy-2-butanone-4-phosphate synthase/GTP cyclohydrolase II, partial [Lysobacteraceae bacterium]